MLHSAPMASVSVPFAFIDGLGGMEMLLVFVIALLLFGGDKLPGFARSIGKTMREFKKAASGVEDEFKRALEDDERKENAKRLAAATPAATDPVAPHAEDHGYGHDEGASAPTTSTPTASATPPAAASTAASGTPSPAAPTIAPPTTAPTASDEPLAPVVSTPKPAALAPAAKPATPPTDFL